MRKNKKILALIAALAIILSALVAAVIVIDHQKTPAPPAQTTAPESTAAESTGTEPSSEPTEPSTVPTEPPVEKIATATISSVGDMLMHQPVFRSGYNSETGEYELEILFDYIYNYFNDATLAVGNLETTLAGADFVHYDGKVGYSGYPQFNCPDSIIDAMKYTGFDVVLTANNHSNDTGSVGLRRNLEVIRERELAYLGTRLSEEEPDYIIADCNGIKIGLLCYSYDDSPAGSDYVTLNGHKLKEDEEKLVSTFNENELDVFYTDVAENMAAMEAEGAEAVMLYLHWGDEYQTKPNGTQKEMAQELCNLGVDVIVGGHPHVVQPVQLLTSENDEDQKTLCVYSLGNAVSNQRLGNISYVDTAHTEDGLMFNVTFAKYSDGTVIVESAQALPMWVNKCRDADWNTRYYILPLDTAIADWKTEFDLTDSTFEQAQASYDRTMAIVGAGMEEVDAYYAAHQQEVEQLLGVQ